MHSGDNELDNESRMLPAVLRNFEGGPRTLTKLRPSVGLTMAALRMSPVKVLLTVKDIHNFGLVW